MADLTQQSDSQAGMTDLINATKGGALNTGALVQSNQNLVASTNNQVTQTTNLVTQTTNLVTQATNQVTQLTNLVTQTTNLVTAVTNLTTAINNTLALGPWSTWSPTITSKTGTITTLGTITARYAQAGKNVYFFLEILITTNGTGASYINASLPVTAKSNTPATGRDGLTAKVLSCQINTGTSAITVQFYDGTYPGANGAQLRISGTYEAQ